MNHLTKAEKEVRARESFERAITSQSIKNDAAVIEAFMMRGYAPEDIRPRVNVFTYEGWQYLGRQVRKGQKSIGVTVYIPSKKKDKKSGEEKKSVYPSTAHLFHIDQTDPIKDREQEYEIKLNAVLSFLKEQPYDEECDDKLGFNE